MTVPISAITAIAPVSSTSATSAAGAATGAASGGDFASALGHGLDAMTSAQTNVDNLSVQAATGQLTDPAQLTAAATQAQLMTQLVTTIQSKAVAAFNTIMGMQA